MKVEISPYLVSRIEDWKEGKNINDAPADLLTEVADAIANERKEYENHLEDLIDSIN